MESHTQRIVIRKGQRTSRLQAEKQERERIMTPPQS